jgi:hypothetical protein
VSHADTIRHALRNPEWNAEGLVAIEDWEAEIQRLEGDRLEAIRLAKKTQRLRERAMDENQQLLDALERVTRAALATDEAQKIAAAALAAVRVEER